MTISEEVAAKELRALVDDLRFPKALSPAERAGLIGWCGNWRDDFNADARACQILVDAMARFTMHFISTARMLLSNILPDPVLQLLQCPRLRRSFQKQRAMDIDGRRGRMSSERFTKQQTSADQ
jgi:hypothetical protein